MSDLGGRSWGQTPGPAVGPGPGATPPPGSPASPSAPPPPPPSVAPPVPTGRRGRPRTRPRILRWVVLFLVACITVFVGFVGLAVFLARGPVEAANRFLALVDEGRLDEAYASLCPETRATVTIETFRADMAAAGTISRYRFVSTGVPSDGLTRVSGEIRLGETESPASFGLRRIDGTWTVCAYPPLSG